ncbi:MAG: phosphoglycolate phosphatase [Arenimonas sp.]
MIAPLVLFDLDGTLVDSAVDLLNALNQLAARESHAPATLEAVRPVVSKGARAMLAVAFPERDEDAREALRQPFLDTYAAAISAHSTPFEGVQSVLAAIEAAGARWGIVSNKPYYLAVDVVLAMGWNGRCAVLLGGDSLPRRKPDPDQLLEACARLGVAAADCVYVGDDERDIVAAQRAGMKSVAALWGYRLEHEDPRSWAADLMVEAPVGLLQAGVLAPR